jgi:hypothetical protein
MNIACLDASTATTGCLLLANHTDNNFFIIKAGELTPDQLGHVNTSRLSLCELAKQSPSFLTIKNYYLHLNMESLCRCLYQDAIFNSRIDENITPKTLEAFKQYFIEALRDATRDLTPYEKQYLLECISKNDQRLLYKEFYENKNGEYSYEVVARHSNSTEALITVKTILSNNPQPAETAKQQNFISYLGNLFAYKQDDPNPPQDSADKFEL